MRTLYAVVRPYLVRLVAAGLVAAAADAAGLALLATATWLLVSAAFQPPLAALTVAIVSVRALAIGRGTLRYTERLAGHDAVLRVLSEVRARLFAALAARRRPEARSGDLLSRVVSDVEAVQDLLLRVLVPGAAAVLAGTGALVAGAVLAPPATPVIAAGLLVAGVLLPVLAVRAVDRTAAVVAPLRADVATAAVDLTHGAADLAAYGATPAAVGRLRGAAGRLARAESRIARTGSLLDAAGMLVAGLTAAGTAVAAMRGGVDPVTTAAVTVATMVAVEVAFALVLAARRWAEIRVPLQRVTGLLDAAPEVPVGAPSGTAGDGARGSGTRGDAALAPTGPVTLVARGVGASHDGVPVLSGVDLTLTPGRRVAVVGPSGSGKSTLLSVLAGLHPLDTGTVTVDGVPLSEVDPVARCRLVSGLLADAHVFHASVRDNLLLARPEATQAELDAACAAAGLLDWVRRQPAGYDTVVGEDGGLLSGGQRQRLALARALLASPAVLLLDEPTEGLPPATARAVLSSVLDFAGPRRSGVVVPHLLRGLEDVDESGVLDDGRVVQRGSHHELMAAGGWYRDQVLVQRVAEEGYHRVVAASAA